MAAARSAIDRFIYDLLGPRRRAVLHGVRQHGARDAGVDHRPRRDQPCRGRVDPVGGTAIYDAIAKALPMAAAGRHKKKALLVISDGNDTSSTVPVSVLRQRIRDSEVLVYALGVDGAVRTESGPYAADHRHSDSEPVPTVAPARVPCSSRRSSAEEEGVLAAAAGTWTRSTGERVNPDALREVTDDTGGRTEIVRASATCRPPPRVWPTS
jgi:hypothetical protein